MAESRTLPDQKSRAVGINPVRFDALDSWRGICALLVAAFHFPLAGPISQNALVRGSFLFVDFFFVLSGFVFAHAYSARLANGMGLKRFLIMRFGRLMPLHLFMLLVLFVLELTRWYMPQLGNGHDVFTGRNTLEGMLASVLMVHSIGFTSQLTWNTPSWSISAEMIAYIAFGCILVFAYRSHKIIAAFIALASLLVLYAYSPTFIEVTYDLGAVRCLFGFSGGVLAHGLYKKTKSLHQTGRQNTLFWTGAEMAVIVGVVAFFSLLNTGIYNLLAPLIFSLTVLVFVPEGGLISRLLANRPFVYLGAISYSIYLTHLTIQASLYALARYGHGQFGWKDLTKLEIAGARNFAYGAAENGALVALMLFLTIVMSALTYRYVERPSREWFRKFAARAK
jgi:peptidoglycan/LPS O-acetylase OafA/YrhL